MSTINANHRYPDYLAQGLAGRNISVINQGVAGQRLLFDNIGPSSLNSFGLNVVNLPRVRAIILQVGINDLANPPFIGAPGRHPERISAQQVIDGMKQFIDMARSRGIVVFATTITPSGDLTWPARGLFETYSLPDVVAKRLAVNAWIRESRYAPVIDFDKALLDPANPNSLRPDLASAGNLHPNDKGYQVMAETALAARP
ncbi:GDSL-type esterase/lipase family protein [Actinomycetospora chiangmaiensis]|uniref:GDSL-type esterase/lipase family protein n=1 Tax=Actinomycetospora chiangmaiensis TaxID=402650 RepID=UPI00035D58CB|nr:GDSL-type esterase/lipase family protein [Actinomycetospora chiangmaiensis]